LEGYDPREAHLKLFDRVADADILNRMLYLDSAAFMPGLNLLYNDKMSMACSVEVRVPFLDTQFAEWTAANISPRMKLRGSTGKHVLREAMKGILPAEVLTQKKAAFGAPIDYWLANDLREMVDDLLSSSRVTDRGIFRPTAVDRLVREHRSGRRDWSSQIWQILTLELWQQKFVDGAGRLAA
jgi:asparagine synthase (glutamine-hydrolysing)